MPAKVIIQSGISAGASHWIERTVIRIGSDPRSDVCLPSADVPSHALTLEYRDGLYRVYNRCQSNVFVGAQIVAPGKALAWPDTDILQLNDIELVLDLDDDPAPQPVPVRAELAFDQEPIFDTDEVPEISVPAAERPEGLAKGSSTAIQVVVIVLCVLGCIGLIVREQAKGADRPNPPSFSAVIRQATSSPNTSPQLVQRLQYAESAAIRGNDESARVRFGELRDDLIVQKDSFAAAERTPELAILDLVEYRLGQLE